MADLSVLRSIDDDPQPSSGHWLFAHLRQLRRKIWHGLPHGLTLQHEEFAARHQLLRRILAIYLVAAPIIGALESISWLSIAVAETIIVSLAFLTDPRLQHQRLATAANQAVLATLAILSATAVIIGFFHGLGAAHYLFAVDVIFVALYEDWIPYLLTLVYIMFFNVVIGTLDPDAVFYRSVTRNHPWTWGSVQIAFTLLIVLANLVVWKISESQRIAAQQLRSLQSLTETGLSTMALDALNQELVDRVRELLDVELATLFHMDQDQAIIVCSSGLGPEIFTDGVPSMPVRERFASEVAAQGRSLVLDDIADYSEHHPIIDGVPIQSLFGVPLIVNRQVGWVLVVGSRYRRHFDAIAADLLLLAASRVAAAISYSQTYEQERLAAETLQHSLLPASLPVLPGFDLAARYLPGETVIGGDWYDTLLLPNGHLALVIGDVVGHGLQAASMMGQLRNALRAYAIDGYGPAQIANRVNRIATAFPGKFATLIYLDVQPSTGIVSYINAGHPSALLQQPDGHVQPLERLGGLPLGIQPQADYQESSFQLDPGAALVLYTDGLVENRIDSLSRQEQYLETVIEDQLLPANALCSRIIDRLLLTPAQDDVSLVMLRLQALPERLDIDLQYPAHIPVLGEALQRWLSDNGAANLDNNQLLQTLSATLVRSAQQYYGLQEASLHIQAKLSKDTIDVSVQRSISGSKQPSSDRHLGESALLHDEMFISSDPSKVIISLPRAAG
jgi:sigma-B regulation protein RsbU (phosphoserine phosphatase)